MATINGLYLPAFMNIFQFHHYARVLTGCLLLAHMLSACATSNPMQAPEPCSKAWYQHVETSLSTGDGLGHGPDLGSDEWKSVIEFKLGIRGDPSVPARNSAAWCYYIDTKLP